MSKFKELVMRELGLSSPTGFSLIDEQTGIDHIFTHPDEQIAPEKRKKMVSIKICFLLGTELNLEILMCRHFTSSMSKWRASHSSESYSANLMRDLLLRQPFSRRIWPDWLTTRSLSRTPSQLLAYRQKKYHNCKRSKEPISVLSKRS